NDAPIRNDNVAGPYTPGFTFGAPQSLRVACGNCNSPFSVAGNPSSSGSQHSALISCLSGGTSAGAAGLIAARCPHCRKVTSVGPAYARVRLVVYSLLTFVALIIAIGVTVGTVSAATSNKALYFLWTVLYLVVIVLGLRAVVFFVMPVSSVDVPVFHM
ncbi:phosphatidylinositol-4,5-bisphosphate 4-phosphatase, partial [Paragonimus westermani]